MRFIFFVTIFYSYCMVASGQGFSKISWYSETNTNGIVIQNSYPKGGPYRGRTIKNFNYSQLVFVTRVVNETKASVELDLNFSADSIPIPNSPDTFVKLFLPSDTMTRDKLSLYNYGLTEMKSFDKPTRFKKTLAPSEECLFYLTGIFYQTKANVEDQSRGGNRAELVLEGQKLFYKMLPQIDLLPCGQIVWKR